MGNGNKLPQVGRQPHNEEDHATQLLADIAVLQELRTTRKDQSLLWTLVSQFMESVGGYVQKSREKPSIKELQTDLHTSKRDNEALRKDVTLINAIDSITGNTITLPGMEHAQIHIRKQLTHTRLASV